MKDVRWQKKINDARKVEREILKWVWENFDQEATIPTKSQKEYDILTPQLGNIEVKEDRLAHRSGNYALEFEDFNGQPSGYAATTAKVFIIVDHENVVMVDTGALKEIIQSAPEKNIVKMGGRLKDNKTCKGWLISRSFILNSPYVRTFKRWFPIYE